MKTFIIISLIVLGIGGFLLYWFKFRKRTASLVTSSIGSSAPPAIAGDNANVAPPPPANLTLSRTGKAHF